MWPIAFLGHTTSSTSNFNHLLQYRLASIQSQKFYIIFVQKSLHCFSTTTEDWKSPRIGLLGFAKEQLQGFLMHA